MTSEQITTIVLGIMLLLGHWINYRKSVEISRRVQTIEIAVTHRAVGAPTDEELRKAVERN